MPSYSISKKQVGIGVSIVILAAAVFLAWFMLWTPTQKFDATLKATFLKAPEIQAYTQYVDTETTLAERNLRILGTYHINTPEQRFASIATTTLTIPGPTKPQSRVFTLTNISIRDDVYTKIETESKELQATIPSTDEWHHFTRSTIPAAFENIAIVGPTLDNLQILSEGGAYLTLIEKKGEELWDGVPLQRYSFRLSGKSSERASGTLKTLLDRIGNGSVDLWIDEERFEVRLIHFRGENYLSTTTIANISTTPPIEPPLIITE